VHCRREDVGRQDGLRGFAGMTNWWGRQASRTAKPDWTSLGVGNACITGFWTASHSRQNTHCSLVSPCAGKYSLAATSRACQHLALACALTHHGGPLPYACAFRSPALPSAARQLSRASCAHPWRRRAAACARSRITGSRMASISIRALTSRDKKRQQSWRKALKADGFGTLPQVTVVETARQAYINLRLRKQQRTASQRFSRRKAAYLSTATFYYHYFYANRTIPSGRTTLPTCGYNYTLRVRGSVTLSRITWRTCCIWRPLCRCRAGTSDAAERKTYRLRYLPEHRRREITVRQGRQTRA